MSGDSLVLVEKSLLKLNKNINFTVIPGPVYGATQKLGFVVLPMLVYNLDKSDNLSPPSSSALLVYFDFSGSWQVAVKQSLYWNRNKWRAFFMAGTGQMHVRFFGIGRDTVVLGNDASDYDWTRVVGGNITTSCYRKIYKGLFGGFEYSYGQSYVKADDSAGVRRLTESGIVPEEKIMESILIPTFVWDNRDNIFWTTKGYYANLNLQFSNKLLFGSSDYSIVTGWVSGYHSLLRNSNRLTLAWHFFTQLGWGDIPYARLATYGRGDNVTGYTAGKYMDHSEITLQTELRYDVWKFIGIGGYVGTGKLFPDFDRIWKSVWLHYGGARLYINVLPSRNIRLRFDIAVARKDLGFYLGIGQGF
jgi:outer membrane protein assembly factor BamA